ncbi:MULTISPECIES: hybrid sensor histidine kinase/response regulator, partial [Roseixanthobacter]|uniref:hybrid sensor histidine kinase/response regulator n=1 Tax=Xanthobacteraceae TaxID=335928 RepID=UPI00372BEAD8
MSQPVDDFEDLFDHAPCGYLSADAGGRITRANATFVAWTGHPVARLVGRKFPEILNIAGRIYFETHFAPLLRMQGFFNEVALEVVKADGSTLPVLVNAVERRDETGAVSFVRITVFNATDRRRYEREMLEARRVAESATAQLGELNATLEARVEERTRERDRAWRLSQDLLVVAGTDGRLGAVNTAWTMLLGWPEKELVGSTFMEFTHPDDLTATLEAFAGIVEAPLAVPYEYRLRHADGSYRWFAWTAAFEDGCVYANGRHVTAEREQRDSLARAEEALRQAQKMEAIGQLTGGIAHDFNNLLAGISGSLELMQNRMGQGRFGDLDRYMSVAQGAAKRAAALTHRLLAFSRRQTLDPKPTNVNRLIAGVEELIRRTIGPQVTLDVVGAAGAWPALIDPGQLENALLNLCINA